MNTVKIKRKHLVQKLTTNREAHQQEYQAAASGYREACIEELRRMHDEAVTGKPIRRSFNLPEHQDHTSDYDMVLSMLEMSVDSVIELSSHDFKQFVMDDWSWSAIVKSTAAFYTQQG